MATLRLVSLVRSELSIILLPTLTIRPPSRPGSTRVLICTFLPIDVRKHVGELLHLLGRQRMRRGDVGADLAALAGEQRAKALQHVGGGEQAPVPGDQPEEVGGEPGDAGLGEDRGQRLGLVVGGDHRAAHQAAQVVAVVEHALKRRQIALDLRELPLILGKLEECGGIAPRHARHHRIIGCHVKLSPGNKQRIARRRRVGRVKQKSLQAMPPAPSFSSPAHSMGNGAQQPMRLCMECRRKMGVAYTLPAPGLTFATRFV